MRIVRGYHTQALIPMLQGDIWIVDTRFKLQWYIFQRLNELNEFAIYFKLRAQTI